MNKKTVLAISLGVLAAAVLCVAAGLIVYFTAAKNAIKLLVGIFMISMGTIMAVVPILLLTVILIMYLINKNRKI